MPYFAPRPSLYPLVAAREFLGDVSPGNAKAEQSQCRRLRQLLRQGSNSHCWPCEGCQGEQGSDNRDDPILQFTLSFDLSVSRTPHIAFVIPYERTYCAFDATLACWRVISG